MLFFKGCSFVSETMLKAPVEQWLTIYFSADGHVTAEAKQPLVPVILLN